MVHNLITSGLIQAIVIQTVLSVRSTSSGRYQAASSRSTMSDSVTRFGLLVIAES